MIRITDEMVNSGKILRRIHDIAMIGKILRRIPNIPRGNRRFHIADLEYVMGFLTTTPLKSIAILSQSKFYL
jgi:hypothetical protein